MNDYLGENLTDLVAIVVRVPINPTYCIVADPSILHPQWIPAWNLVWIPLARSLAACKIEEEDL